MLDYSIGYYFLHYYPKTLCDSSFILPLLTHTPSLPLLKVHNLNSFQKNKDNKNFLHIPQPLLSGGNPIEISYIQLLGIKYWFENNGNRRHSLIDDCTYSLLKNINLNKS
ncbi:MAG: hypothetical protein B6D44_09365 [Ignavibacteriales bacterium UTCHB2]|jgi:hypothetical protein|nr:MAG: hypothetical protein B6D44_09365 [Ignavibacteriales bacterium UTCHB2]